MTVRPASSVTEKGSTAMSMELPPANPLLLASSQTQIALALSLVRLASIPEEEPLPALLVTVTANSAIRQALSLVRQLPLAGSQVRADKVPSNAQLERTPQAVQTSAWNVEKVKSARLAQRVALDVRLVPQEAT
jgi:hypothetical protein